MPAAAPAAPPSLVGEFARALLQVSGVAAGLLLLLWGVSLMRDNLAAASHLADAKAQRSTLICQAGHMARGDGSLHDRVFEKAYFVCTDWRTLQAVDEAAPQR